MDEIQPNLLRLVYHMVPPKALGDEGSAQALRPAQAPRPTQAAPWRPPRPYRKLVDQIQPNLLRLVYHMVPPKAVGDEGSA
ncbi:hypothetical protein Pyn_09400 [Prunus yedoensis var. nudiflora]|uniref:Uncharacterized protein n=1 Tax=Prunus yedoensis var. nudiflora TaxID=2094558 RepID=A0A314XGT1_PRUYE|nr:hypothetical protein Pyn_09400 [Prunus yedoensis var. nudiflora]